MKKIQKETKSFYDVFVAMDGTEFCNQDECRKYEQSAKGVVMAKIKNILVRETTEEDILGYGSCDSTIWIVKPTTQSDVDAIMQAYLLINPYMADDDHKSYLQRASYLLQRALDENDILFIGRGYEMDGFWFLGTRNSMKDALDEFLSSEKKD